MQRREIKRYIKYIKLVLKREELGLLPAALINWSLDLDSCIIAREIDRDICFSLHTSIFVGSSLSCSGHKRKGETEFGIDDDFL
jgi:hypothetical protein